MRRLLGAIFLGLAGLPAAGATPDEVERLWQALEMPSVISIMREEGLAYGASLDADMLEGRGGPGFTAQITRIYDADRMLLTAHSAFSGAFTDKDITEALRFYESDTGIKAVDLEIEARRAMLVPEVDRAARDAALDLQQTDPERHDLIERFAQINDLIEANVAGALNANYAFFQGMHSLGALGEESDEAEILAEVWSQEPILREETEDWVAGFLTLSYQGLTLPELEAYVEFSQSEGGKVVNRTLFSAFDVMFNGIARQLGAAVGGELVGEEL